MNRNDWADHAEPKNLEVPQKPSRAVIQIALAQDIS